MLWMKHGQSWISLVILLKWEWNEQTGFCREIKLILKLEAQFQRSTEIRPERKPRSRFYFIVPISWSIMMINWSVSDLSMILWWRLLIKVLIFVDIKYGELQTDQKCFSRPSWSSEACLQESGLRLTLTLWRKINCQRSEPTSCRQAGTEKMLWGGHTPAVGMRWVKASKTVTDRNGSGSGFVIFLIVSRRRGTTCCPDRRPPLFPGQGTQNEGERGTVSYFKGRGWGRVRGEGKAKFWQLEFGGEKIKSASHSQPKVLTQWKWKSVNSKDKCYRSSCPYNAHMVSRIGLHPNPLPERRKICLNVKLKLT